MTLDTATSTATEIVTGAVQTDLFAAGMALGVLGLVAASLRGVLRTARRLARRRLWVSLTLDNRHIAYRHLLLWMEGAGVLLRARHVRMTDARWADGTTGVAPAPGRYWFLQDGRLAFLDRDIDEKARVGGSHDQRPMETLTVSILFGRLSAISGWIEAGRQVARTKDRIGPGLHVHKGDWWDKVGDVPRRSIDTVLVDDGRVDAVLSDMRWFYDARDWYADRGVPWRRGYLFHGPPGTGKSSLIRALASELALDIASLDIGRSTLTDDDLREALIGAPDKALIAIEDVDAVFTQRGHGEKPTGVSFSGLLNAIDGYAAQEGRALVMTTNHRERLDPALIRPGRVDMHVELGLVGATTARRLFDRFFPREPDLARAFEAALGDRRLSPAALQGWLLTNSSDPQAAARATVSCRARKSIRESQSSLLEPQTAPACNQAAMTSIGSKRSLSSETSMSSSPLSESAKK